MFLEDQIKEILSWRLASEFLRRFPNRFFVMETHPGGGTYDCLSLLTMEKQSKEVFVINRQGSLQVGRISMPDWLELMTQDPRKLLDSICHAAGLTSPKRLPASTPSTVAMRFIADFLAHSTGRLERWECRNGYLDTSGYGGGIRRDFFSRFPDLEAKVRKSGDRKETGEDPCCYWFLLRADEPAMCLDINGIAYGLKGTTFDLPAEYKKSKRIWPLIFSVAKDFLP